MSRLFNASNKPGTCLWCGRKLYHSYSHTDAYWRLPSEERAKVRKDPAYRKQDPGGPGKHARLFDTDSCAVQFGTYAAESGYRFLPKQSSVKSKERT